MTFWHNLLAIWTFYGQTASHEALVSIALIILKPALGARCTAATRGALEQHEWGLSFRLLYPGHTWSWTGEGLQGRSFFRRRFRSMCENIFFRTFSLASQSIKARQKLPVRGSFFTISLCAFYMLDSRWIRSHYFHTPNANAACKPSRSTIKCVHGT